MYTPPLSRDLGWQHCAWASGPWLDSVTIVPHYERNSWVFPSHTSMPEGVVAILASPDNLAQVLHPLKQMHSDPVHRCGLDRETYEHLHKWGSAQGTTKHYKESKILEEIWREAKSALSREMTEANFRTYISDTYALAFDRSRGILFVQTPDPLTAEVLAHPLHITIIRTVHNLHPSFEGVPVQDVQLQSRR